MTQDSQSSTLSLTLSELLERLKQRGVDMSLSTLSEFIKTGDIADLLQVGGKGNRREFLLDTVDILAAFFPEFKRAGGKLPQAPGMLRSFLKQENTGQETLIPVSSQFHQTAELALLNAEQLEAIRNHTEALIIHAQALRELPALEDALLTMKAANEQYGVPYDVLKDLRVSVGKSKRVRRSNVLRYIAERKP